MLGCGCCCCCSFALFLFYIYDHNRAYKRIHASRGNTHKCSTNLRLALSDQKEQQQQQYYTERKEGGNKTHRQNATKLLNSTVLYKRVVVDRVWQKEGVETFLNAVSSQCGGLLCNKTKETF